MVAMGVLAINSVILVLLYAWRLGFSLRFPSSASIKRKKRAAHVSVADISRPLLEEEAKVSCVREFTYQSLVDATQGFSSECQFGADSLGKFFIGKLVDTDEVFAIREIWVYIYTYTLGEFVALVSLLSQANHPNLAKLIGYSYRLPWERALVYEYVRGGTLADYLYDNEKCLDWKVRMEIARGVARAVEYLQKKMKPSILLLNIEPCNIWLDVNHTPKLSAYGMPMMYSREKEVAFPREMIKSYCYAEPDYVRTKNVTIETDIYGFGILLIKIITAKHEYLCGHDLHQNFLKWVQPYLKDKQKMVEMVDPKLQDNFELDELCELCDIAEACLNEQPKKRPSIVDLVERMNHLGTPKDNI